ncbi:cwfJ domain-containing protein [Plectosphaerella plurivora]|uniref:CwfJ domain-containing protein n=1 Tax=Plectosphaerella plurivora TaxID=936078 RepID=A0A9P8VGX0_9PEZI|nr:cwfJ domain-containing protein [Plectosphaerella plurivora]
MASIKVLVFGSLNGALEVAFTKAATLHAKNNFSFAILTGDVFGPNGDDAAAALISGAIKAPLPTYFTVGMTSLPSSIVAKIEADEEIAENIHYLGKRSTTKTTDGIRIVALGGQLDPELMGGTSKEQYLPFHSAHDAKTLKGAGKADILLTAMWPAAIWAGSKLPMSPENQASILSTQDISQLCSTLKPRYHLSASAAEFFWEREPFLQQKEEGADTAPLTRFISMAPFGNASKAKGMYAFSLNLQDTAVEIPPNTTASPFAQAAPKRRSNDEAGFSRFSNGNQRGGQPGRDRKKRRHNPLPPPGPDRCFFCLSNPNLSLHMVCSVGDDSYLATAKGPLATSTTWAEQGLGFPGHFIITPLAHTPQIAHPAESYSIEDGAKTYKEMSRYREALQAMVAKTSGHRLGAVTWEISRARNIHSHWQFHPVPAEMVYNGIVEAGFKVEAENQKYAGFEEKDLSFEEQTAAGDYFRLWIWADNGEDKIKGQSLVMPLPDGPDASRFDLQYPRRVVAKLLGLESRFIWQDCSQTEEEEKQDVKAYREAFKEWDFTTPSQA